MGQGVYQTPQILCGKESHQMQQTGVVGGWGGGGPQGRWAGEWGPADLYLVGLASRGTLKGADFVWPTAEPVQGRKDVGKGAGVRV